MPLFAVYDVLVNVDPYTEKVVPHLAESLTASPDSKEWTIKLRPGLKFSDGTPFNAEAIRVNWNRLALPETAAQGGVSAIIKSMTSYITKDDTTLVVTFPYSRAAFANDLAGTGGSTLGMIASPTAMEKYGKTYGTTAETTSGAGAFILKEWVPGDHSLVVKNPNYYAQPRPYLDSITFKPVSDPTTKADAILAGDADLALFSVPSVQTTRLAKAGGIQLSGDPQVVSIAVSFNISKPPYNDIRVRQAMVLATDQTDLIAKTAPDLVEATTTWYPKTSALYDPSVVQKSNNLAEAQKLIDAYVAEKGGPVQLPLQVAQSAKAAGDVVAQQWSRLKNVEVAENIVDATTNATATAKGTYSAQIIVSPGNTTNVEGFYSAFRTGQPANLFGYTNFKLDVLLEVGRGLTTLEDRKANLAEITKIVLGDALLDLLYRQVFTTAATAKIKGLGVDRWTMSVIDPSQLWVAG
ncbi:MAG: ABC transporter substrate-binding protein [Actinomycetota bacterium]